MIRKILILFIFLNLTFAAVFSQKICPINIEAIEISDSTFEKSIEGQSNWLRDEAQNLDIKKALNLFINCKATKTKFETLFDYAFGGNFNTWLYFKLENKSNLTRKVILQADFGQDSLWIFDGNILINNYLITSNEKSELPFSSYRKFVLELPAKTHFSVILKQSNRNYLNKRSFPQVSNLANYESKYFKKTNTLIYAYFFLFSYLVAILFFVIIHYFNFKEKVTLYYLGYLFSVIFVVWRNFEDYQPYATISLPMLPWFATKLFHTACIFIFYTLFLFTFLENNIKWVKISKILIFGLIVLMLFLEIPLQLYQPKLSYLVYFFSRQVIIIIGFLNLIFLIKSTSYLSKYIFIGSVFLMITDLFSGYLPGPWSSLVPSIGVWLEVNIFTIVLGLRSYHYYQQGLKSQLQIIQLEAENEKKASQIKSQIAQDIHDDLGLHLTSLKFLGYEIKTKLTQKPLKLIIDKLNSGLDSLSIGLSEIIWSMNPEKDSITEFAYHLKKSAETFLENQTIKLFFEKEIENEAKLINGVQRRNLLLCMKEAMHNVVKHSHASQVNILFNQEKDLLYLSITDDGIGFKSDAKNDNILHGNGLKNMEKRMRILGGKLILKTEKGSSVVFELPFSYSIQ